MPKQAIDPDDAAMVLAKEYSISLNDARSIIHEEWDAENPPEGIVMEDPS